MKPDEMQAPDEDRRCEDELAKIEPTAEDEMTLRDEDEPRCTRSIAQMKLKISSVASGGPKLSALKAIYRLH